MAQSVEQLILEGISQAFQEQFGAEVETSKLALQPTRKDFEGTYTFVVFPYLKITRKKPEETGQLIGEYLKANISVVTGFNVVKGFLNLVISEGHWINTLFQIRADQNFGTLPANNRKVMVEYSSPNTNKPLHLGHLRNNFLGYAVSNIMEANGYEVMKTNLVNDRGIHICKSMVAYEKLGKGETPNETLKGDQLVGKFYVEFDKAYKEEVKQLSEKYLAIHPKASPEQVKEVTEKEAPILLKAQEMLRKWEQGDPDTVALWKKMNGWVYDGHNATYTRIGVSFDKIYYESDTYLLGKKVIEEGLEKALFFQKEDGSVWIDLTDEGLDQKLLLRKDGTAVYMTQDMGTADLKHQDFPMEKSVYVVGNEQDYHFNVLQRIMKRLGRPYADGIYHLSYGMVDLPSGKMKSREGTVVDADQLVDDMVKTAKDRTQDLGKIDSFESEEAQRLYETLALGALKYYLLRVDPKKRMLFNPEESIDFQGNTGVYIQYTFAKVQSILRKAEGDGIALNTLTADAIGDLQEAEEEIITLLYNYPDKVKDAGAQYSPATIASYCYDLSKAYSRFYAELPIFSESDTHKVAFRVMLSEQVARILQKGMGLLGVGMPKRM